MSKSAYAGCEWLAKLFNIPLISEKNKAYVYLSAKEALRLDYKNRYEEAGTAEKRASVLALAFHAWVLHKTGKPLHTQWILNHILDIPIYDYVLCQGRDLDSFGIVLDPVNNTYDFWVLYKDETVAYRDIKTRYTAGPLDTDPGKNLVSLNRVQYMLQNKAVLAQVDNTTVLSDKAKANVRVRLTQLL